MRHVGYLIGFFFVACGEFHCGEGGESARWAGRVVLTQVPKEALPAKSERGEKFLPPLRNVPGSRIASIDLAERGSSLRILTPEFASACSPVVSFDGKRVVFAGKKASDEPWNVWEMEVDGSNKRRIVELPADCITPTYLPSIYTLDNIEPRDQVVFASDAAGAVNESGAGPAWSLYTCELSGRNLRRISFNLSADFDPTVLPDGRILFTSWQRYGDRYSPDGLFSLLTVNTDGTDLFPFYGNHELPVLKSGPAFAETGWIYFVESDGGEPLGGGSIAAVNLRRNLKWHRVVARDPGGFFHSPSLLPDGKLVVSHRKNEQGGTYGLFEVSPETGEIAGRVFDNTDWHEVEASAVLPRPRPKGRSSVVNYDFDYGDLYCLNCYISELPEVKRIARGSLRQVRVVEGIPLRRGGVSRQVERRPSGAVAGASEFSLTWFGPRRILGEAPIHNDGSFYIRVPAGTPVAFQILDEKGTAVATHKNWMWAMPKEARGCIGCHEDRELTPPNRLPEAVTKPPVELTALPEKRRTVDFQHEISPVLKARCIECHAREHPRLDLAEHEKEGGAGGTGLRFSRTYEILLSSPEGKEMGAGGRYVKPGSARESPLIWHLFGERLDKREAGSGTASSPALMPPKAPLSDAERKLFIEWVDLGAQWSNRAGGAEDVAKEPIAQKAAEKGK